MPRPAKTTFEDFSAAMDALATQGRDPGRVPLDELVGRFGGSKATLIRYRRDYTAQRNGAVPEEQLPPGLLDELGAKIAAHVQSRMQAAQQAAAADLERERQAVDALTADNERQAGDLEQLQARLAAMQHERDTLAGRAEQQGKQIEAFERERAALLERLEKQAGAAERAAAAEAKAAGLAEQVELLKGLLDKPQGAPK